jgi:two-component system LytT family response regulator
MIRTIIVDDERHSGDDLKSMLELYHSDIRVEALCYNEKEAEASLKKFKPNLVFLDVELGNEITGFDLLKKIPEINFDIIFTTGYNQYAIQAIKFNALDYLIKPIDENELKVAIEKYRNQNFKVDVSKIENLITILTNPGDQQNKIPLPTMNGYDMFHISDIIYCEGVRSQTLFVLNNGKEIVVSMTLKECEDFLTQYNFFRIHKSYLINLNYVNRYIKGKDGTGTAVLLNKINLTVSKGFREKFIEKLSPL